MVVVKHLPGGRLWKVVGGTPQAPTVAPLGQDERIEPYPGVRLAGVVGAVQVAPTEQQVFTAWDGSPWPWGTWTNWYNKGATSAQQDLFDRVTKVLDAGGIDYMQGGANRNYIDRWQYTDPDVYKALVIYRDTGGRRALFARLTPGSAVYGTKPISVIRPGGPIEKDAGRVVLHPGRYTYSAIAAQGSGFKSWLDAAIASRSAQLLRTQASEEPSWLASLFKVPSAPIYIDYEFLVAADLPWDTSLLGNPAWLPETDDVVKYWGKPTPHAAPSLDALREAAEAAKGALKGLASLALLGAGGYVLFLLAGMSKARPATATAK
jgi:hypothetical protein